MSSVVCLSRLFLRTLREDPADAELPGHKLLIRSGYIRRAAPGVFTWLPLGLRVLRRIEAILREEMAAIGAQEVSFPALLPREPYEATGRWTEYGDNVFRLKDRRGADMLLGPTHEEMFALAVKDMYSSYKDLPLYIYQVQTKYRDEARPRAGLLRGREFIMKDSYSFDIDDAGLQRSYDEHRAAYIRLCDRLGLNYVVVQAMSGAMGGSASEEFLAISPIGEDTFVQDEHGYAANTEAVVIPTAAPLDPTGVPSAEEVDTPDTPTIETLVEVLNTRHPRSDGRAWTASDTLKNVVVMLVYPDGRREPLVIGLPGDRQVDPKRLEAQVAPAEVVEFGETDFAAYPQLVKGYIGPGALGRTRTANVDAQSDAVRDAQTSEPGIRYLLDPRIAIGSAWATGANKPGVHVINLVYGRDFTADGTIQAAEIVDGDPSPSGNGVLHIARGIEMGHIFQLGRKYAQALGVQVLNDQGALATVTMGSYGFGVSRAVAALAEEFHDDLGLTWPSAVAPADVHIVATGKDASVFEVSRTLADQLAEKGLEVFYDDRPKVSPGVKFKDAELIGVPVIVVVGKGLASGVIEIRDRRSSNRREVSVESACRQILAEVRPDRS